MDELSVIPWLRTALIAEDHGVIGPHIQRALERWGAQQTRLVRTTCEVEAHARELGPDLDLILADIHLEDGDCASLVPTIRRYAPRAVVGLMTGEVDVQRRLDLMSELRVHMFLSKPFDEAELHRRLAVIDADRAAAGWYYDLVRAKGMDEASDLVRELARDHAMIDFQGDVGAAAKGLGVSRGYMYKLLARRTEPNERAASKPGPSRRKR